MHKSDCFESVTRLEAIDSQDYQQLKQQCAEQDQLFEDELFPANNTSFYFNPKATKAVDFRWLRPSQLKSEPVFRGNPTKRISLTVGKLGSYYILGALATLALHKDLFDQVVPAGQSFDAANYRGIFHFRFWYFGKWKSVVVDDRLPTRNGQLWVTHDKYLNEFWPSLLEKAYAKLIGCYDALFGSYLTELLEDFTGGLSEFYHTAKISRENLFEILHQSLLRQSYICAIIETGHRQSVEFEHGLYGNTFYILRSLNTLWLAGGRRVRLVKLRNPASMSSDWRGAWGYGSREWASFPSKHKLDLVLEFANEMWLTFEDFYTIFNQVTICHVEREERLFEWETIARDGVWDSVDDQQHHHHQAPNFYKHFAKNVKFHFFLPKESNILVGVMQKFRKKKKLTGLFDLKIGFQIYCLDEKITEQEIQPINMEDFHFPDNWFQERKPVAGTRSYINYREVVGRYRLKAGNYIVVPNTVYSNRRGQFLLRIFIESSSHNPEYELQAIE